MIVDNVHLLRKKQPKTTTGELETAILAAVVVIPEYIDKLNVILVFSREVYGRILRRHKSHPFHISLRQESRGSDFQNRYS